MLDIILAVSGVAFILLGYVVPAAWAVGDTQQRGKPGALIVFLFWFFGPATAIIWLMVRPKTKLADHSPDEYTNAEDALAAAALLDRIGEWNSAIALYEHSAKRWPNQQLYISACITAIHEKQAMAQPSL